MGIIIFLIAFITLGEALGYHFQAVQDTPEVANAKAQHFAAVASAKAAATTSYGNSKWDGDESNSWSAKPDYTPVVKYHGPIALPPGYDKYGAPLPVLDTHEVAHAKSAQLAALTKAGGHIYPSIGPDPWSQPGGENSDWSTPTYYAPSETKKYNGPLAQSPGFDKYGAPLPVLETPEVSHAKAEHFAAYGKVMTSVPVNQQYGGLKWKRSIHEPQDYVAANHAHIAAVEKVKAEIELALRHQQQVTRSWTAPHYESTVKYHGPIALPPGYDKHGAPLPVMDTHEVAHAKSAQLAALTKAGGNIYPAIHSSPNYDDNQSWSPAESQSQHYDTPSLLNKYRGPIALPPGYDKYGAPLQVLDTPEVAAQKAKHLHFTHQTVGHQGNRGVPSSGWANYHNHW